MNWGELIFAAVVIFILAVGAGLVLSKDEDNWR